MGDVLAETGLYAPADVFPPQFTPFPKISRWNRSVVISEKLDGVNVAVHVTDEGQVVAQSRKQFITPGKGTDLHGFAQWTVDHADELRDGLGVGVHFGEWWGQGIRRGYGLSEKRFSLFNTHRWGGLGVRPECCDIVPVLDVLDRPETYRIDARLFLLTSGGSVAAPGFMRPEGIVVFHTASNAMWKATVESDDKPKGE